MGNWEHMMAYRGHDEYYDERDLNKAFEDGRKQGWREAMEEAKTVKEQLSERVFVPATHIE